MRKFYMIDLDGTMYHGKKIIPSAKRFIDWCIKTNQPFLFLTNNASRTQQQAAQHMFDMGFTAIRPEQFYTAAMAAADTMAKRSDKRKAAYLGEAGLEEALLNAGFELVDENADFLFVGLDRNATYETYSRAARHVLNGAVLVGTNNDRVLLTENGIKIGNGSAVAMIEYCTNQKAVTIGKPHSPILEGALNYAGVSKEEVVIIGDNLETDILCGMNAHVETILVTTGVHQAVDIDRLNIVPTRVVESLEELIK